MKIALNAPATVNRIELSVVCRCFYIGSILTRAFNSRNLCLRSDAEICDQEEARRKGSEISCEVPRRTFVNFGFQPLVKTSLEEITWSAHAIISP
jgi:hypothetical protein